MEAGTADTKAGGGVFGGAPAWLLGLIPLAVIIAVIGGFAVLGGPGLGDRTGVPVEELAVETTRLEPGTISLTIRNDGADPVAIAQVAVNDAYSTFTASDGQTVGRLGSTTLDISYPWIVGEAYTIFLLTSTGGTVEHVIDVAAETPEADTSFFALMALLGIYVGVIPVSLGMLWLPFVRRIGPAFMRALIAFTVGLLAFLAIDATLEGFDIAGAGPSAFGGIELVFLGAIVAFLALSGVDAYMRGRRAKAKEAGASGGQLALMVAIGIGLHNLGEGLAIGTAYSSGALALGAFLVIGFAIHNTTEGLAIVGPMAKERPGLGRLLTLGLVAGAPAILGAWIGAAAFNPSLASLLFGLGVGAIVQVIVQLLPVMRDDEGRALHGQAVIGLLSGVALLYLTGLLVSA